MFDLKKFQIFALKRAMDHLFDYRSVKKTLEFDDLIKLLYLETIIGF